MIHLSRTTAAAAIATGVALAGALSPAAAAEGTKSFEVYGFAQLDYIQDFDRVNPDWEDTLRPSRIPTDPEEFGDDGQVSFSVKQSRFGVKATLPTSKGDINTKFEFDMFGVGSDAGETTIRLRHAYGEFGQILAGQTNSLFMDGDIFPNTIDYWGPAGMVFLRNPQIRWTPIKGDSTFAVAIENPGNDIDSGQFREVGDIPDAQGDQEYPDFTTHYRMNTGFGHVQAAGILRWIGAEVLCNTSQADPDANDFCPNGQAEVVYDDSDLGWGINLTTVINVLEKDAIRAGLVYGEGIASYMNDGGMDAGPDRAPADPGVKVEAVELTGVSAYYDHWWSDKYSSSIGYAFTEVDNTPGQTPDTFKKGQYASVNLLYYPVENVLIGGELLWGEREDFDGANNDATRVQISVKFNFGTAL
jgi:DcaP outer membrane protein